MDSFSKKKRSEIMSRIKSSNTAFETAVFKELRKTKIRFKTHYSQIVGKPDIALPAAKKAVFLHSDFWHGWQLPKWRPRLLKRFWVEKIERNRVRDKKVILKLRRHDWKVLVVWEHQINQNRNKYMRKIETFLHGKHR